jgi:hypothetical protein
MAAKKIDFKKVRADARKGAGFARAAKASKKPADVDFAFGANIGRRRGGRGGGS